MIRQIIFLFFFLLILFFSTAQTRANSTLAGFVHDAQSGEPLPYTNVFLANTTIGDAANDDGKFVLEKIPPGSYQLIISRIGYEMQVQEIVILPNQSKTINIDLIVKSIEGEEVRVEAEKNIRQWKRDLREFEREFIGVTPNAAKCKIMNPEVLSFRRENYNLIAYSEQPIIVENKSLGYRLDIVLDSFHWGIAQGQFIIYPKYSLLDSENERQQEKWEKKRKEAFFVSMRNFFVTLADGNPFPLYKIHQVKEDAAGKLQSTALDSMPIEELNSARVLKRYVNSGILSVEHWSGGVSSIDLIYDYIDFDAWGNIYPPNGIRVSGYWGQFRVADSLPFDYHPERQN